MKRAMPWSDEEDNSSSKESSLSQSDSDADEDSGDAKAIFRVKAGRSSKEKGTEGYNCFAGNISSTPEYEILT